MKNTSWSIIGVYGLGFGNCFRNNYNCIERYITYYRLSTEFIDDLPIMIVVQAITLPFLLKFGGDKGRIAMIGAFGGLAVITLVIVKGAEAIFNIDLVSLLDNLPTVSMGVLIAIAIIIALLMLLVSMKISLSIMNKKEF